MVQSLIEIDMHLDPVEGFNERLQLDRQLVNLVEQHGEKWPEIQGCYNDSGHSLIDQRQLPPYLANLTTNPPTLHNYLIDFITRILQITSKDRPAVLLDIGGGIGSTWQIAADFFQEEVRASRLVFAVSNLTQLVEQRVPFVNYISSTFRNLVETTITLPNGQTIPLQDHVDFAHESHSLTRWSQVPELDIPAVGELLSPVGSYLITRPDSPYPYIPARDVRENQIQRTIAIGRARTWLQTTFGLRHVPVVEMGELQGAQLLPTIFRMPEAPKIEI